MMLPHLGKSFLTACIVSVIALTSTLSIHADVLIESWQFNDANGTTLNNVANDGTVGTSWNFGGPRTQNGGLNVGDTNFFKYDAGSGNTFRNAEFDTALTTGIHIFEYRVQNWDFGGTDNVGVTNNGVRFNIGSNSNYAQMRFEVSQNTSDIRGRVVGSGSTDVGSASQFQYGSNDVNTRNNFITLQLTADLDSGDWSARTRAGSTNAWTDLTSDGTGLTEITRLQFVIQGGSSGWEYAGVADESTEFAIIDYATLSSMTAVPEPASFSLFGLSVIILAHRRRRS